MKLIIPLAGFGTRMRPHTWTKPKPLINVAGKPFLGHLLDRFVPLSIDEVVIIYGWLGDQIRSYLQESYSHYKMQFVEQVERKGQSHALWLAREHLHGDGIIIWVDTLFDTDLSVLDAPEGLWRDRARCGWLCNAFRRKTDFPREQEGRDWPLLDT
jgi:glucose-1-phosphate thymidylyltransferase